MSEQNKGRSFPLGATVSTDGTNFSVYIPFGCEIISPGCRSDTKKRLHLRQVVKQF
jgi:hypothetical protein